MQYPGLPPPGGGGHTQGYGLSTTPSASQRGGSHATLAGIKLGPDFKIYKMQVSARYQGYPIMGRMLHGEPAPRSDNMKLAYPAPLHSMWGEAWKFCCS